MPVDKRLTNVIPRGTPFYRITPQRFLTTDPSNHVKVVDGQGAMHSKTGGRYNNRLVVTVYLAEDLAPCFSERMHYFHREQMQLLDQAAGIGATLPFVSTSILWRLTFKHDLDDVLDLTVPGRAAAFGIIPSMLQSPHDYYKHLQTKREDIQQAGYRGMRVGSSRCKQSGNILVLFQDHSAAVDVVEPNVVEFSLITRAGQPFLNHAADLLDYTAGHVRMWKVNAAPPPPTHQPLRVEFNH